MARSPSESRSPSSSPVPFPDPPAPVSESRIGSSFRSPGPGATGTGPNSTPPVNPGPASQGGSGAGPSGTGASGTGPSSLLPSAPVPVRPSGLASAGRQVPPAPAEQASMGPLWTAIFAVSACAVLGALAAAALGAGRSRPGAVVAALAALVLLVMLIVLRHKYGAAAEEQEQHEAELQHRAIELERSGYERQAQYTGTLRALSDAVDHLVRAQLPAALNGSAPSPPLPDSAAGNGEAAALCGRVTTAVAEGAAKLRSQFDDQIESSRLAVVTLARRVQASAHRIQEEATRMAGRHPADSDVLESSMRVDHAAAQQARHAQSVAVLCGEWPGQQWPQALPLLDVVRAASSRIVAYRRVAVSGEPDTAATASVVEPLIHLIAELLANATQSSPPTTQVLVTVRTVQRGAVIEMDDGGVGMEEHQLDQAREIVSGHRLLRLGDLGEIPQTGMAVVGQYVHRHGFRVDLMPSPYGGVRAVVLVPANMVENLEQGGTAQVGGAEPQPAPVQAAPVQAAPVPAAPVQAEPARPEPPRAEPRRAEPPPRMEPVGTEPARMEAGRAEPARTLPPPRTESAGMSRPEPAGGPATTAQDTGSLPQRRSRRGESEPAAHTRAAPAERPLTAQTPEQAGAWMAAFFGGADDANSDPPPGPAQAAYRGTDPPGSTDPPGASADSPDSE